MNYYQKSWLPALPLEPAPKQRAANHPKYIGSGFKYNGFILATAEGSRSSGTTTTSKPRRPRPRTVGLSSSGGPPATGSLATASAAHAGAVPKGAASAGMCFSCVAHDSGPQWHSSVSPFDRILPAYVEEPLPEGQRLMRRIASADHASHERRSAQARAARRGLRYAADRQQHVARSSLVDAIKRREKYLTWAQALLGPDEVDRARAAEQPERRLAKLREEVVSVLSSLCVATIEVLEAVAEWRGVLGRPGLAPVWRGADYLAKLRDDTSFLCAPRSGKKVVASPLDDAPAWGAKGAGRS